MPVPHKESVMLPPASSPCSSDLSLADPADFAGAATEGTFKSLSLSGSPSLKGGGISWHLEKTLVFSAGSMHCLWQAVTHSCLCAT